MKKSSLGMLHCLISLQRSPNIMTTQRSHSIIIKRREGVGLFCGSYKCSILNFVQLFINSFSHFHHIVSSWTELTHEDFLGTIFVFLAYFYKSNTLRPRHHILEPFWITHTLIIWPTQMLGPDVLPCAQCAYFLLLLVLSETQHKQMSTMVTSFYSRKQGGKGKMSIQNQQTS